MCVYMPDYGYTIIYTFNLLVSLHVLEDCLWVHCIERNPTDWSKDYNWLNFIVSVCVDD